MNILIFCSVETHIPQEVNVSTEKGENESERMLNLNSYVLQTIQAWNHFALYDIDCASEDR